MTLLALGLSHKTAPLPVRERLAFASSELSEHLLSLVRQGTTSEAAILSTCNRTEFYCTVDDQQRLLHWLSDEQGLSQQELNPYLYVHRGHDAVRHMMRVACGLDSMMLGEPQILGQMKSAYSQAQQAGTIGTQLHNAFRHVFAVTKQVRTQTAIGANPVSIAYASVNLAKRIFADLSRLKVLLIGAGDTISLVAKHLQEQNVTQFLLANRNPANAVDLAERLQAQLCSMTDLPNTLEQADIVISATASDLPILGKGMVERAIKQRKHRPMFFIDLAVPRDIEPECAQLPDVFLYNIDDLESLVDEGLNGRRDAAKQAEEIIELEVEHFHRWQRSLHAVDNIRDYRQRMQHLADKELQLALKEYRNGQDADVVMRELTHRMIHKIMHQPSVRLRKAGYDGREDLLELSRELFSLDD